MADWSGYFTMSNEEVYRLYWADETNRAEAVAIARAFLPLAQELWPEWDE